MSKYPKRRVPRRCRSGVAATPWKVWPQAMK
jgi:hypothetical protein